MKRTIALLTDFGTQDFFVGAMKGVILSINESTNIVDITHDISPQDIQAASFTLRACYNEFPEKTIFVAVVDPGVGSERRAILVETGKYFFIAPDNGLLSFIFNNEQTFKVFEITNEIFFCHRVSKTFHGRDIFSPSAAHLSNGIKPGEFGNEIKDFKRFDEMKPEEICENETQGEIIYIDRFGNLITNLKKEDLPEDFLLEIGGKRIGTLKTYFAEAKKSEVFMIFGGAEFLEIAACEDSAKNILKIEVGEKVKIIEK